MTDTEPDVILFEASPYRNIDAIVQHDGRVIYFYLNGHAVGEHNPYGTRAVWVRNLVEGPYVLNEDEARQGVSPLLPRTHCNDPKPQPLLVADRLKIVWFEEGNGAALLETNPETNQTTTLAVLPPWSGLEGFHGYADGCAAEGPLCWPMPDNPQLQRRIDGAIEFWTAVEATTETEQHPFPMLQAQTLAAYRTAFNIDQPEIQETYFSIDGGQFPPRGLVHLQKESQTIVATVGLAMCPQPAVELFVNDPANYRRIELAIRLPAEVAQDDDLLQAISRRVSSLAAYPWSHMTWLGPGHTCNFSGLLPDVESALLVHDQQPGLANSENAKSTNQVNLPSFRGDRVSLLWLLPITPQQQTQLESGELTADQLI